MTRKTRAEARGPRSVAEPALGEVAAVWAMYAVMGLLVFVTYARVDPHDLYHVSHRGLAGGASRALVYLNYPVGLAAIALVAVAWDRLAALRWPIGLAVASVLMCSVVFVPGVVDEADLDARPVNVLPAIGVAIALGLTVTAVRRAGMAFSPRPRGDSLRIALAAALLVLALPWLAAELGFYLDGPFMGSEIPPGEQVAAVHLGHHHGLDGTMFALAALLLSRTLATIPRAALRAALGLYLALMLVYGLANVANDAWLEQLVKRGWLDWRIPSVLEPSLTAGWALIVLGTIAVYAIVFRRLRPVR